MNNTCECGHKKNFHRIMENNFVNRLFPPKVDGKICNVKECMCLRFTPVEE